MRLSDWFIQRRDPDPAERRFCRDTAERDGVT